ncbi:hypothetical protein KLP28_02740 [Nocardioidaceae bacterium]|nr:hypothetical protein KLP28_02740 [Nocardioidaceae bacterium]
MSDRTTPAGPEAPPRHLSWAARLALVLLALGAVLVTTLVAGLVVTGTGPPSSAERARAAELASTEIASPQLQAAVTDCVQAPVAYGVPASTSGASRRAACLGAMTPPPTAYLGRPPLRVASVAAYDMLLLGLLLTAVAGLGGLVLGRTVRPLRATVAGAAVGLTAAGSVWVVVAVALLARGQTGDVAVPLLQVTRVGLLTALASGIGAYASRRLGGAAPAVLVVGLLGGASLLLPVDVLDVAGAWITASW